MDKDRMRRIADFVERENYRFDMRTWGSAIVNGRIVDDGMYDGPAADKGVFTAAVKKGDFCGTAACVAGTANLIRARDLYLEDRRKHKAKLDIEWWYSDSPGEAGRWLGLTNAEMDELFYGGGIEMIVINRKRRLVPDALRYMADTGDVNWVRAMEASRKAARCRKRMAKRMSVDKLVEVAP